MNVWHPRAALAVLVVGWLVVGTIPAPAEASGSAGKTPLAPQIVGFEPDSTVMKVDIREDGTAVWRVEYRRRLADANDTAAFEAYRERVESEPLAITGPFRDDMAEVVDAAAAETGRDMTIRNVTVEARQRPVPEEFGVVAVTFEWTGFAAVSVRGELRSGPVLSGFFLTDRTSLLVSWPEGYRRAAVRPDPDTTSTRAFTWEGPQEFPPDQPAVVLRPTGLVLRLSPVAWSGLALLCAGAVIGVVLYRRTPDESEPTDDESTVATDVDPTGEEITGAGRASPPPELLSDAERVLQLLEERGGRVKQQAVIAEFDWSETKASQVVSDLEEADRIEVYRIGRENVLALPGEMDV